MARADQPIVVGGCHRTGTSVIRRVLDAHSRIHCAPEVPFFRDLYGDYADDRLHHLRFTTNARVLASDDELLEVLGAAFVELHRRAAQRAGKSRWADKAPENVLYTREWQRLLGGEWLFVHAVRNPLDTLASMVKTPFPLTLPADLEGRIAWYRRYTESGIAFGERNAGRYRLVVYEELVADPERMLGGLMEWLGEDLEPAQLAFNSVSHDDGLEDPNVRHTEAIHGEGVDRWREVLTEEEAAGAWAAVGEVWTRIDPEGRWRPPAGLERGQAAAGSVP